MPIYETERGTVVYLSPMRVSFSTDLQQLESLTHPVKRIVRVATDPIRHARTRSLQTRDLLCYDQKGSLRPQRQQFRRLQATDLLRHDSKECFRIRRHRLRRLTLVFAHARRRLIFGIEVVSERERRPVWKAPKINSTRLENKVSGRQGYRCRISEQSFKPVTPTH